MHMFEMKSWESCKGKGLAFLDEIVNFHSQTSSQLILLLINTIPFILMAFMPMAFILMAFILMAFIVVTLPFIVILPVFYVYSTCIFHIYQDPLAI